MRRCGPERSASPRPRIQTQTVAFTFRELLGHGSVSGRGRLSYRFAAGHTKVLYRGSGHVIRGTGRDTHAAGAFGLTGTGYPNATTTISISAA